MLFLNILHKNPQRLHSAELVKAGQKFISKMIEEQKLNAVNLELVSQNLKADLFDLYMEYNEEVFNPMSKALSQDYCRNLAKLEKDQNEVFLSTLHLHCKTWQACQGGVSELVQSGKHGMEAYNGRASYANFAANVSSKLTDLQPILNMVDAYLLADLYAFWPILADEAKIEITDWSKFTESYKRALKQFTQLAKETHLLAETNVAELVAI